MYSPYGDKKIGEFFKPITLRAASRIGMNYSLPNLKKMKVRGYIFSRAFMGERVPQHIQNQIIRKFCEINNLEYSLSASEYAMKDSYLMLEEIINEKSNLDGIVFYSLFQLPENKIYRNNIYKNIIKRKKNFFSVENYKLSKKDDILELEEIWDVKSILPNCYKGF